MQYRKSEQDVVQYFIDKYGSQEPLASPIDRGFNRLAWAVPVRRRTRSACGIATCGRRPLVARRAADPAAAAPAKSIDPALEQRLSDELRDLD